MLFIGALKNFTGIITVLESIFKKVSPSGLQPY